MNGLTVVQYAPSPTMWERALDKLAGWLVGCVFKVDEALADLGGDD